MNNDNTPSPEERARIVQDALKHAGCDGEPHAHSTQQQVLNAAFGANTKIQLRAKPVIHAIKQKGSYNREDTQDFIYKLFREEFATWSKEEILELVSMMYAGAAMGDVEHYMNS